MNEWGDVCDRIWLSECKSERVNEWVTVLYRRVSVWVNRRIWWFESFDWASVEEDVRINECVNEWISGQVKK